MSREQSQHWSLGLCFKDVMLLERRGVASCGTWTALNVVKKFVSFCLTLFVNEKKPLRRSCEWCEALNEKQGTSESCLNFHQVISCLNVSVFGVNKAKIKSSFDFVSWKNTKKFFLSFPWHWCLIKFKRKLILQEANTFSRCSSERNHFQRHSQSASKTFLKGFIFVISFYPRQDQKQH